MDTHIQATRPALSAMIYRRRRVLAFSVAIITALAMLESATPPAWGDAAWTTASSSLSASPYASPMLELAALGIVGGYPDGSFRPGANVSRVEFAAMIVRALRLETDDFSRPAYTDITPSQAWAYGIINAAEAAGVLKGDPNGTIRANASVTGGEVAAMILRALGRADEVSASAEWPSNYIDAASRLGIWQPALCSVEPMSRGAASAALAAALSVEARAEATDGATTLSPHTLLDRHGVTAVLVNQVLQIVPSASGKLLQLPDGSLEPADGSPDTAPISPSVLWVGALSLEGLLHRPVALLIDNHNQVIFASARDNGIVSAINRSGDVWTVELEPRGVYVLKATTIVTLNHEPSSIASISRGVDMRLVFDVRGEITAVEAYESMTGRIATRAAGGYWLSAEDRSRPVPLLPAEGTRCRLNGAAVNAAVLGAAISEAGIAIGTVHWDSSSGRVLALDCYTYDGPQTFQQPIVSVRTRYADYRYNFYLTPAGDEREYALSRDCRIMRDGGESLFDALRVGDLVSFRTDEAGEIAYLEALSDNNQPQVTLPAQVTTADRFTLTIDEAIDPSSVGIQYDGRRLYADYLGLERYVLAYSPETRLTTVTVFPALPLRNGETHTLTLVASDYSGHAVRFSGSLKLAGAPISLASAEWLALTDGGRRYGRVTLFFDGDESTKLGNLTDAEVGKFRYIPGGTTDADVFITACEATDYTITIWLSGTPANGARIEGQAHDNSGRLIPVSALFGE
ncbi:MAG: S-layer homology domain-containing protein [Chloroflexota bacterium]